MSINPYTYAVHQDEPHVAKFMPQFDGPYPIVATNETHSTVTLALLEQSQAFPIFHTSEVRPFPKDNDMLFPTFALHPPNPVTVDGSQEFFIDKIVNKQWQGRRKQYLVRWRREGPEGDLWLDTEELDKCEALDIWLTWREEQEEWPEEDHQPQLTIRIPPQTCSTSEQGGV